MSPQPARGDRPLASPHGDIEEIDGRVICHVCGRDFKALAPHARQAHGMTVAEYRVISGLGASRSLACTATRALFQEQTIKRRADGRLLARPPQHKGKSGPKSAQTARRRSLTMTQKATVLAEQQRPLYLELREAVLTLLGGDASPPDVHKALATACRNAGLPSSLGHVLKRERQYGFLPPPIPHFAARGTGGTPAERQRRYMERKRLASHQKPTA